MKPSVNYEKARKRWRVEWRVALESEVLRKRKYFNDSNVAHDFAREILKRHNELGYNAVTIDAKKWREVIYLEQLLGERGSLRDAVEHYLRTGQKRALNAFEEVTAYLGQLESGKDHYSHVKSILRKFAKLDTLDGNRARNWVMMQDLAQETREGYRRVLRAFFSWLHKSGKMTQVPPLLNDKLQFPRKKPVALDIKTASKVLAVSRQDSRTLPFVILKMFAGLRTGTAKRLTWDMVEIGHGITIPAKLSKNGQEVYLEGYPPILWQHLSTVRHLPLGMPTASRWLGNILTAHDVKLPKNIFRHSFASFHFTLIKNAPLTAYLLEHQGDPTTLFRHYRGTRLLDGNLIKSRTAKEYFNLPL